MYYIKLIILALLLSSCASTSKLSNENSTGVIDTSQSEEEIEKYRTAITFLNNNNLDAAKKIFLEFTSERPDLAGPYVNLAVIAIENKDMEKAYDLINIALTKNPNLAQALNLLAFLEQEKGNILKAEKHYLQAINNKKNYAIAHYNLALLYDIYLQDIDKAIQYYEHYMQLTSNKDKKTAEWIEHLKSSKENS